jgi:hypothetical protein
MRIFLLAIVVMSAVTPATAQELGWLKTYVRSPGVSCLGKCWFDKNPKSWVCSTAGWVATTCAINCGESRKEPTTIKLRVCIRDPIAKPIGGGFLCRAGLALALPPSRAHSAQ